MKIDSGAGGGLTDMARVAGELEEVGFDGIWTGETSHDPFLMSLCLAQGTSKVSVGTSIMIAFARTPMVTAEAGWDLAQHSEGRFILGMGSQIKPHIERRFSMPWSQPAARMREYVLALRAIWDCWRNGTTLDFAGEFYTHTLMTPMFTPEDHGFALPPIYVAGVGDRMVEAAGEVADGFFAHAFTTQQYFETATLPALERGLAKAGRRREDLTVCCTPFVVSGRTDEQLEQALASTRQQIAFYASTPAYEPVLAVHGWESIRPELTRMSKEGKWVEMAALIDDDMLNAFAVVGTPAECGAEVVRRWGRHLQRMTLHTWGSDDVTLRAEVLEAVRANLGG
jgi:probable F420-dependent oxidoreductase